MRITVRGHPGTFEPDTWVAVTGTDGGLDPEAGKDMQTPVIVASSVDLVPAPEEPYET